VGIFYKKELARLTGYRPPQEQRPLEGGSIDEVELSGKDVAEQAICI
jgi:hypothetical protein